MYSYNIADRKSRQSLRRIKKKNNTIIVAVGCYAQIAKEELQQMQEIDIVLGNKEKKDIVQYVEEFLKKCAKKNGSQMHGQKCRSQMHGSGRYFQSKRVWWIWLCYLY